MIRKQRKSVLNRKRRVYDNVLQTIASPEDPTPLVRINKLCPNPRFTILGKLEWYNPFGSIKDRTALNMLLEAEALGLFEGKTLVEPSSGNTGIALAGIGNVKDLKVTIVVPEAIPEEKKFLLRILGAEVEETYDGLCPASPKDGARALARSMVESPGTEGRYYSLNQYENPDNVMAHYKNTGPEIWRQTRGKVTHFIAGLGTTGTLMGVGKYLKEKNPDVKVVAVEPTVNHNLPGLKNLTESLTPEIYDKTFVDEVLVVEDDPAYRATLDLIRQEGILAGPTSGAVLCGALRIAEREKRGMAVALFPDNIFKYISFFKKYL